MAAGLRSRDSGRRRGPVADGGSKAAGRGYPLDSERRRRHARETGTGRGGRLASARGKAAPCAGEAGGERG